MPTVDLPVPFSFPISNHWVGNDGNWSAFTIGVGTPPQYFDLLPSTVSSEIWVPSPDGCTWAPSWLHCGNLRGVQATSGPEAQGFEANSSSTWDTVGLYTLPTELSLFGLVDTAHYGQDIIDLGFGKPIPDQIVAAYATLDFWSGIFGLGDQPASFAVRATNLMSMLSTLKNLSMAPSLSFGYTAGASYRGAPASLIVGGYDRSAFQPSDLQFTTHNTDNLTLPVNMKSLLVDNSLIGTISVPLDDAGITLAVDSTVSHLWLPKTVCDALSNALGLEYDSNTGLYIVNGSSHSALLDQNPTFTFTLAVNSSSKETTNIVLPYSAFDLSAYLGFYNVSTRYFPIRRAANATQYILGRTFLQEAYMVVDWERGNFTLGQVSSAATTTRIIPIAPFVRTSSKAALSTGAIVGVAVGAVAVVVAAVLIAWLVRRLKKRAVRDKKGEKADRFESGWDREEQGGSDSRDVKTRAELLSNEILELDNTSSSASKAQELHGEALRHQLMSTQVFELDAQQDARELDVR